MKSYLCSLIILCFICNHVFSQDHLDVRGNARIQDDVTIESLSDNNTRQVLVDANGTLKAGPSAHVLSIGASAFSPIEESAIFLNTGVILIPRPSLNSLGEPFNSPFHAPVQLPDHVVIDSIAFHFLDMDSEMDQDIVFSLGKVSHLNDTNIVFAQLTSTTSSMGFGDYKRISSAISDVVNNEDFYYYISIDPLGVWKLDAGLVIKSAVIYYSYP